MSWQSTERRGDKRGLVINPKDQFFVIHGDNEAAMESLKGQIVDLHVPSEQRDECYREIVPSPNQKLQKFLSEITTELATVSFLPDMKRVMTLYSVSDLYEAGGGRSKQKKAKASAAPKKAAASKVDYCAELAKWIESELPSLPAVLIVYLVEDYEKWKKIATANPVVELARKRFTLHHFKESTPQFSFFDALFDRNVELALKLWREWQERAPASPRPLQMLAVQMRLLMQAKLLGGGLLRSRHITEQQFRNDFLPSANDKNIFSLQPEFRRQKLINAAGDFSFQHLVASYQDLLEIQKYAIPLNSDRFVPDRPLMAELWILKFCQGSA